MSEGPVIQFPDKMRVESPKTDHLIDSILKLFVSLSHMLEDGFKKILDALQVLKKLPDLVYQFQQEVSNQFSQMFTRNLEVQIFSRQANILAAKQKHDMIESRKQERITHLQQYKQKVLDRYRHIFENLASESDSRLKKLDNHAYSIVDKIYPNEIQARFSFDSGDVGKVIAAHADDSVQARSLCLDEGWDRTRKELQQYIKEHEELYQRIDSFVQPAGLQPGCYEIPFLIYEVKNIQTGAVRTEIISPEGSGDSGDLLWARLLSSVSGRLPQFDRQPLPEDMRQTLLDLLPDHGVPESEQSRFAAESLSLLTPKEDTV